MGSLRLLRRPLIWWGGNPAFSAHIKYYSAKLEIGLNKKPVLAMIAALSYFPNLFKV